MITTIGKVKKLFMDRTEDEQEIIWMYLNETEENRKLIMKIMKLIKEDPQSLDFAKDWKGSAEELRTAVARI